MTKPMKTEHLESGHPGHNLPKDHPMHPAHEHGNPHHTPFPTPSPSPTPPPVSGGAVLSAMANHPDHSLTPEDFAAGKTPNSGKLHKDGSIVHGQSPEQDAKRAAERAAEAAVPEVTPEPTPPPVV